MATFVRTQAIEHSIGGDGRFSLRVTSPDVELRARAGEAATVRVRFEVHASSESEADEIFARLRFRAITATGSLEVAEPKRGEGGIGAIAGLLGIGSGSAETSVSAELPPGAAIDCAGVSSDVTATGFRAAQQYRTVSGDLVLDQLGGDVRVRGVSGAVSLRADQPIRLEVNTVSGDASAFAPRFDDVRLVTVSGDLELEGELAPGRTHRIETLSGDLTLGVVRGLTLDVRGLSTDVAILLPHRSEGSRHRRRYVIGDGATTLLFSSMSGDVIVGASRRVSASPPSPPAPPAPPDAPVPGSDDQMAILRALERGEIDVETASILLSGNQTDA